MITPKQQFSVFNLLPPSTFGGCSDPFGIEGLERMRNNN
jgi:hypothetical protein